MNRWILYCDYFASPSTQFRVLAYPTNTNCLPAVVVRGGSRRRRRRGRHLLRRGGVATSHRRRSLVGAHDDEAGALHLAHVVESEETHEAARVLHLAVVDLLEHLAGVRAAVHRQLVHRPVAVVVVSGGHHVRAISADGEAILLVGELLVGERGEEGHVLVLLLVDGPHLHGVGTH